jgi:hypothetical protein
MMALNVLSKTSSAQAFYSRRIESYLAWVSAGDFKDDILNLNSTHVGGISWP